MKKTKKKQPRKSVAEAVAAKIEANRRKLATANELPEWLTKDAPTREREAQSN